MNDPIGDDPKHGLRVGGLGQTGASSPAQGPEEADDVGATRSADGVGATAAVDAASVDATAAIAQDLATGAIDAATARSRLIDAVVASQIPSGASPEFAASVRSEVEALLATNPFFEALLRPS